MILISSLKNRAGTFILSVAALVVSVAFADSRVDDVTLTPPPGFIEATAFNGYLHPQFHASIEIRELEAPIMSVLEQFSPELFEERGFEVRHIQRSAVDGRTALVYFLIAPEGQPDVDQWQLLMGDEFTSLSIAASFPRIHTDTLSQPLGESLVSVRWARTPQQQLFRGLPFTVSEAEDLRFIKRSSNSIVLARIPEDGTAAPPTASVAISHLVSEAEISEARQLSKTHLEQLSSLTVEGIMEESETTIDGIKGYQIIARGQLEGQPSPVRFQQIIAYQPRKYLLVHSVVPESSAERYQPQVEAVIASIRFKAPD